MQVYIKSTNIELSDSVVAYIHDKLHNLDKFVQNVKADERFFEGGSPTVEAWVEVGRVVAPEGQKKGDLYRAEIQMKLPGSEGIRAEAEEWDLHQAIDRAKDEMQRLLKQYKGKQDAKFKRGRRNLKRLLTISPFARLKRDRRGRVRE